MIVETILYILEYLERCLYGDLEFLISQRTTFNRISKFVKPEFKFTINSQSKITRVDQVDSEYQGHGAFLHDQGGQQPMYVGVRNGSAEWA